MKHILSIFAAILFIINIVNAQTEKYETRLINGKPFIIYQIKEGETWANIAEKFGIAERSLIDANKQANGSLKNVVTLKVPIEKSTNNAFNENTINNKNSIQIEPEKALNDTDSNKNKVIKSNKSKAVKKYYLGNPLIEKSTVLEDNLIKKTEDLTKELNKKELQSNSNIGETKVGLTHIVLDGETIEFVAKKYKITISDIANWNNLNQNKIRVGQELIVSLKSNNNPNLLSKAINPESNNKIKNSEIAGNFRFVEEKGLCFLSEKKFIGIAHNNAPVGTLLLLTNTENYKKIYVRVTSILINSNEDVIIQVDKNTAKELAFNSSLTNVSLSYSTIE